jgi:hypothetical protein
MAMRMKKKIKDIITNFSLFLYAEVLKSGLPSELKIAIINLNGRIGFTGNFSREMPKTRSYVTDSHCLGLYFLKYSQKSIARTIPNIPMPAMVVSATGFQVGCLF